jgi:hypothetical protein
VGGEELDPEDLLSLYDAVPEALTWLRPHLGEIAATSRTLREDQEPIEAFERSLADALDEQTYERLEAFCDGKSDKLYGAGAGDRARVQLRDAFEQMSGPVDAAPVETGADTVGQIVDVKRFYEGDPARQASEEIPFGNRWSAGKSVPTWDVFWVRDTGELAALGPAQGEDDASFADFVASFKMSWSVDSTEIKVLAVEPDLDRLRARLGDWEAHVGERDGYLWLRGQLGLA